MAVYLIDFENVRSEGLRGTQDLNPGDQVVIFYSMNADTLTFEAHDWIMNSNATVRKYRIFHGGKNALDFQLSSYLGYLIRGEDDDKFYIISKDRGYHYVLDFWAYLCREHHATIICAPSIAEALRGKRSAYVYPDESRAQTDTAEMEAEEQAEEAKTAETETVQYVENADAAGEPAPKATVVSESVERIALTPLEPAKTPVAVDFGSLFEADVAKAVESNAEAGFTMPNQPIDAVEAEPVQESATESVTAAEVKVEEAQPEAAAEVSAAEAASVPAAETVAAPVEAQKAEVMPEAVAQTEAEEPKPEKRTRRRSRRSKNADSSVEPKQEKTDAEKQDAEPVADQPVKEEVPAADKPKKTRGRKKKAQIPEVTIVDADPKKILEDKIGTIMRGAEFSEPIDEKSVTKATATFVMESGDKQDFYRRIIKHAGQKSGLEIYKVLKSEYNNLKQLI